MSAWLRSIANAILGKVPGKTGRVDTATRMWLDADFLDDGLANRGRGTPALGSDPTPKVDQLEELRRLISPD